MELIYVLYRPANKQSRYLLLFPLGQRQGKLCALETSQVAQGEINRIRANKDRLSVLSLERKIDWIRSHCPNAYKKGYREIWNKNYEIVSRHPMT